jgi:hypothetical protein
MRRKSADTRRLEWYVDHLGKGEMAEVPLTYIQSPDGPVVGPVKWYWPGDANSREFSTFRQAIDSKMREVA